MSALSAARAGRPLPYGYKLRAVSTETKLIYDALRTGESIESVMHVGMVWYGMVWYGMVWWF